MVIIELKKVYYGGEEYPCHHIFYYLCKINTFKDETTFAVWLFSHFDNNRCGLRTCRKN